MFLLFYDEQKSSNKLQKTSNVQNTPVFNISIKKNVKIEQQKMWKHGVFWLFHYIN